MSGIFQFWASFLSKRAHHNCGQSAGSAQEEEALKGGVAKEKGRSGIPVHN